MGIATISFLFSLAIIAVISQNVSQLAKEKQLAQEQRQIAEKALNDLKKTSPVYLDRAKHSIAISKFDDALIDIRTYLKLNQQSSEAYFLLGRIQQGKMNFGKATEAFSKIS